MERGRQIPLSDFYLLALCFLGPFCKVPLQKPTERVVSSSSVSVNHFFLFLLYHLLFFIYSSLRSAFHNLFHGIIVGFHHYLFYSLTVTILITQDSESWIKCLLVLSSFFGDKHHVLGSSCNCRVRDLKPPICTCISRSSLGSKVSIAMIF